MAEAKQRVGALATALAFAAALVAVVATGAVRWVDAKTDAATAAADDALAVSTMQTSVERASAGARAYLLTGDAQSLVRSTEARANFAAELASLGARTRAGQPRQLIARIAAAETRYETALDHTIALEPKADQPALRAAFEHDVMPAQAELRRVLGAMSARSESARELASAGAERAKRQATAVVAGLALFATAVAALLALLLHRAFEVGRRQAAELAESFARIEQSNRDLDAFAGRIAHDLRNALNPIFVAARLLRSSDLSAEARAAACGRLDHFIRRAVGLLDALLTFSRAGHQADRSASSPIRSVAAEVVDELRTEIDEVDASVDVDMADIRVACPEALLHVVITNLVGNALKFLRGCSERHVAITANRARGECLLRVIDTGPGVPEGTRERVFEPFYRVPGTTAAGTGLGLATVARIAAAYGGRASLTSGDRGAAFQVTFPLALDDAHASAAPRTTTAAA